MTVRFDTFGASERDETISPFPRENVTGKRVPTREEKEAPVGVEPTMADLQSAALATWPRSHLPKYYLYRINAIDRCTVPSKALSKLTEPHYLQHDYHSIGTIIASAELPSVRSRIQ